MGTLCGKNNSNEDNGDPNSKDMLQVHFRTKKEQYNSYLQKDLNVSGIDVSTINSNEISSSLTDIRKVYLFDKKELGHGHFGSVRRAKLVLDPKKMYAVKTINKEKLGADLYLLKRELEILRGCDHPNIAKFYESYSDDKFFHFVLECCSGGDLVTKIMNVGHIEEKVAKRIMYQILLSVNSLHSKGIVHRDIKPDNFLFADKEHQEIKQIDFGLSRNIGSTEKQKTVVGTPFYVAPDVMKGNYDIRCDYWSCGVMLYVMLCGEPPFYGKNNTEIFKKINKCKYSFSKPVWSNVSDQAKSLIKKFLVTDPDKRLSCKNALTDPWFNPIEKEYLEIGRDMISTKLLDRLRNFRTTSRFQKEVIKLMVNINDDLPAVKDQRYVFSFLDYLNNGVITKLELKTFFSEVNEPITDEELDTIIESQFLRSSGMISYTEFIAATLERSFFYEDKYLKMAFMHFDVDNTGSISKTNVKECFDRFGYQLDEEEVAEMIADFDIKNDGEISYEEFLMMMKSEGIDKRVHNMDSKKTNNILQHSIHGDSFKNETDPNKLSMQHGDHTHEGSEMNIRKQIAEENLKQLESLEHQNSENNNNLCST